MIGLKRHSVEVAEYKEEWVAIFTREAACIRDALGQYVCAIEHVGSTAVPGLLAKPIIDVAVAVRSIDVVSDISKILSMIGYLDRGNRGMDGGFLFIKESAPGFRTFHVHVVEEFDSQWTRYLIFRDYLRRHSAARKEYGDLKLSLAKKYFQNREAYAMEMNLFISRILTQQAQQEVARNGE